MKCVLVVDDEQAIRKAFALSLSAAGYAVETAANGSEAIALLKQRGSRVECVLLDVRMPGMNGAEVLRQVRAEQPFLPVIMVSATNDLETAVHCMRDGAFDYVLKPVQREELLERLRRALVHRHLLVENARLEAENAAHQRLLEATVEKRTTELREALQRLERANIDTVRVLAETIEAKDPYTRGHCSRVRQYAVGLAQVIGISHDEVTTLVYGTLLHDIGKIGVPEAILNKPGPLTPEERVLFERHPVVGAAILRPLEFFGPCLPVVRHHHERFDGKGYPEGLVGTAIHPLARITAISDSFDAMTSSRSYRPAMPIEAAIDQLLKGKGSQFDPDFAQLFVEHRVYRPAQ